MRYNDLRNASTASRSPPGARRKPAGGARLVLMAQDSVRERERVAIAPGGEIDDGLVLTGATRNRILMALAAGLRVVLQLA